MARQAPTPDDVLAAAERIEPYLEPTPLVESAALGAVLKLETVQPTGSFKVRGAFSALTRLDERAAVVTASAGNHGLGVAYAAETLEQQATVVCARTASPLKLEKLRRFPIELVLVGEIYDEAEAYAHALAAEGRRLVSAYDDPDVIAGQGTIALELLAELEPPMTIVVPTGGGGLLSGIALWAKTKLGIRVVGVESEASAPIRAALDAGRIVPIEVGPTLADGLAGNIDAAAMTFPLVRDHADDVVVVTEHDVAQGIRHLWFEHGLVVEGSGAIGAGALLAGKLERAGTVVVIVTGKNIAEDTFARVVGTA